MYNVVNGEKRLLSMINATVSHEMRNPLNSIYCQNVKQKEINDQVEKFINFEMDSLTDSQLKSRLK